MIDALLTRPATLRRVVATDEEDEYNQPLTAILATSVWTYVEQLGESEDAFQRDTGVATHRGFLTAGTNIGMEDRLVVDGATYEIVGPPRVVTNPRTGMRHHVEVMLVEVV